MSLVDDPRMPKVGQLLLGRYQVMRLLGEGGFGAVFLAQDLKLHGDVAIKVLDPMKSMKASFAQRFHQEVKLTRQLKHPNTIKIWDAGTTETGCLYMAMEFYPGRELKEVIQDAGRMTVKRVVKITLQILRSLAEAHRLGIIHRDLKPANVMLCDFEGDRDHVKLLDFGISTALDSHLASVQTQTGLILCTPSYAPPEMLRGMGVVPASDLYSVGLMMIEMLSGEQAVKGTTQGDIIVRQCLPDPISIPLEHEETRLGRVLRRATAKPLEERYQSAVEMIDEISDLSESGQLLDSDPELKKAVSAVDSDKASRTGGKAVVVALSLAVLAASAILVVLLVVWIQGERGDTPLVESATADTSQLGQAVVETAASAELVDTTPANSTNSPGAETEPSSVANTSTAVTDIPAQVAQAEVVAPPVRVENSEGVEQRLAATVPVDPDTAQNETLMSTVHITSRPQGASIHVNEERLGETPWSGQLPRSRETLSIVLRADGYRTWQGDLLVDQPEVNLDASLRTRRRASEDGPSRDGTSSPFGMQTSGGTSEPSTPRTSPFGLQ